MSVLVPIERALNEYSSVPIAARGKLSFLLVWPPTSATHPLVPKSQTGGGPSPSSQYTHRF